MKVICTAWRKIIDIFPYSFFLRLTSFSLNFHATWTNQTRLILLGCNFNHLIYASFGLCEVWTWTCMISLVSIYGFKPLESSSTPNFVTWSPQWNENSHGKYNINWLSNSDINRPLTCQSSRNLHSRHMLIFFW